MKSLNPITRSDIIQPFALGRSGDRNQPEWVIGIAGIRTTYTNNDYVASYKLMDDVGRMSVTLDQNDKNMWRVPTLRNLVYTAPYMHNGSVKTMGEAVQVMAKTQLDQELDAAKVADVVAFLDALTGEFPEQIMPRFPPTPGDLLE